MTRLSVVVSSITKDVVRVTGWPVKPTPGAWSLGTTLQLKPTWNSRMVTVLKRTVLAGRVTATRCWNLGWQPIGGLYDKALCERSSGVMAELFVTQGIVRTPGIKCTSAASVRRLSGSVGSPEHRRGCEDHVEGFVGMSIRSRVAPSRQ
ncbi:hypothetical protein H310_05326 [Aphanomyces invadans]|uniref:Uncharacterized protein n=1 Tax=Aphanomyces invadans TaxID=157072 RepID=A0A024U9A3_9STRA|nr:hypothetical protein H310_05326 [Aphanomyces invadans]ETW02849.1 hypothetical protein H310_05326 [Aphanomyces invadans]|eukprot:XP_008868233.1 hypothetical protein H310_05326 [Aphanomyces invadans]